MVMRRDDHLIELTYPYTLSEGDISAEEMVENILAVRRSPFALLGVGAAILAPVIERQLGSDRAVISGGRADALIRWLRSEI